MKLTSKQTLLIGKTMKINLCAAEIADLKAHFLEVKDTANSEELFKIKENLIKKQKELKSLTAEFKEL